MSNIVFGTLSKLRLTFCFHREIISRSKASVSFSPIKVQDNYHVKKKIPKHRKQPLFESKKFELPPKLQQNPKQKFDYFLILDFEATCDSPVNLDPMEIIEFPVLKVNSNSFKIESTFHSYVRPVINPELSSFCTELTGIIQSMVENEPIFIDVFKNFLAWMEKEELFKNETKFAFVTCGDPDLDSLLPVQCQVSEMEVPLFMRKWINIKRSFCNLPPYTWPDNLSKMMELCKLEPFGELHSGLDDATNIARVLADLAERGLVYDFNGRRD